MHRTDPPRRRPSAPLPPENTAPRRSCAAWLTLLAGTAVLCGCAASDPLNDRAERELKRAVDEATAREVADATGRNAPITLKREDGVSGLGIRPSILPELETMAGPQSYDLNKLPAYSDLLGRPVQTVTVSLRRLVRTSVENNVAVNFARLGPALAEAQVMAAEAAFDWTLFSNLNWSDNDTPRVQLGAGTSSADVQQSVQWQAGLRRQLTGGGRLTIQQDLTYSDQTSPGLVFNPNPSSLVQYTLQYDQPLLRNAGSEVTQAEIRIARNAERNSVQTLKRDVTRIIGDVERQYWSLAAAHRDLLIFQRLLERGEKVRDQLRVRQQIDANQAQIAGAVASVERRKADVLRAQTQLKTISDRLKQLVNDPEFPIGSEIVLIPADFAVDQPIKFSLIDSIRAAMTFRPEVQQAILSIDDASIRRIVAESNRLPDLNLRLQTRVSGLNDSFDESYSQLVDGRFIDYIAGLSFEQPIGNRRGEAELRRRSIERMQSVVAYRNTIQGVVADVKAALDRITLNYRLIDQTRTSRTASAENLRVLEVEKNINQGYTAERLDLELRRQEQLADDERQEIQALTEYNSAITDLFAAMGTLLERNGIDFVVPRAADTAYGGEDPGWLTPPGTGGTIGVPLRRSSDK